MIHIFLYKNRNFSIYKYIKYFIVMVISQYLKKFKMHLITLKYEIQVLINNNHK